MIKSLARAWPRLSAYLTALTLALGVPAGAKKLYKYQDQHGRWHFTDSPPDSSVENVETQQLSINRRARKVSVVRRGPRDQPTYHIINQYRGTVELELSFGERHNVTSHPPLPHRFVVPGGAELRAAVLGPEDHRLGWSYSVRYRAMLGDPDAVHRPERPYRLPFAVGASFPVTQGFRGTFSHTDLASEYAVDIGMPEGTPIHAARAGVVMDVANDFFRGGMNADRYMNRANMIRIQHDDGTMAVYAHLRLESAQVVPGTRVETGQLLARSGNTGFSSGPHLHFAVQRNAGLRLVSVPFQFAGKDGAAITPTAGMILTAHRQRLSPTRP